MKKGEKREGVLLMPLSETIKELVSLMKGVDVIDHTSIFLLRTIYVILIMYILS